MSPRLLTNTDYRRMPWRNGGGMTTELVRGPEEGGRFLYRVSIADVTESGPFSRFEGYDRHIMLIEGRGMRLGDTVLSPLVPCSFSGDAQVDGTLTDGPVRDFNLIVDRARASGTLTVVRLARGSGANIEGGNICIIHVLDGALDAAALGETLVLGGALDVEARATATLAVVRVAGLPAF